jgi:hypothetical protein
MVEECCKRNHLEVLGIDGGIILESTGCIWLRIGTSGGLI